MSMIKWTSVTAYTFIKPIDFSQLNDDLAHQEFIGCKSQQLKSVGWVHPYGDEQLVHEAAGCILLRLCTQEKILPTQVIARHMKERIDKLENELNRKIRGKEKLDIRDSVVMELTPRAFSKFTYDDILIIPDANLLLVNSSSPKKCDTVTTKLREAVETLPIEPLKTDLPPAPLFARWLKRTRKMPNQLTMGAGVKLTDVNGGVAELTKQDLFSDEFSGMYTTGREVQKMALHWNESLSFTLSDDLVITRLEFNDLNEPNDNQSDLDEGGLFDASVALIGLSLKELIPGLVDIFGGLDQQA